MWIGLEEEEEEEEEARRETEAERERERERARILTVDIGQFTSGNLHSNFLALSGLGGFGEKEGQGQGKGEEGPFFFPSVSLGPSRIETILGLLG